MAYYTTKIKKIAASNNSGDSTFKDIEYLLDIIAELEDGYKAIKEVVVNY